jgi:carboxyl-terminal processing protease
MAVPGKKHIGFLSVVLVFIFAGVGAGIVKSVSAIEDIDKSLQQIKAFTNVMVTIQREYVDPSQTETQALVNNAIHGMVESLDRYSVYMEKEEAKEFNDQTQGAFGGLGIQVDIVDGWLTVIEPLPDTPAAKAGLVGGDRIIAIGEKSTKGMIIYDAIKELKGEPGTDVTITVARRGEKEFFQKTITRAIINTRAVQKDEVRMLDTTVGYIRLRDFTRDAADEMETAIRTLQSQGMKSLIFDLRDNVGGLLDVAVNVSNLFIEKKKVIVSYRGRNEQEKVYKAQRDSLGHFHLAVLVNEFSASASEIVAGCIQDHRRGVIVGPNGHRTFGKGSVQTLIELDALDGAFLKLTTAKYYTPSGRSISDDKGLLPDIAAPVTDDQRIAIRREKKVGYIPPRFLGKEEVEETEEEKTEELKDLTVDKVFETTEGGDSTSEEIYDIELYTAFQCLKSAEVLSTTPTESGK